MTKRRVSIGVYLRTRPMRFGKGWNDLRRWEWFGGRHLRIGPKTLAAGWSLYTYRGDWHGNN